MGRLIGKHHFGTMIVLFGTQCEARKVMIATGQLRVGLKQIPSKHFVALGPEPQVTMLFYLSM